MTAMKASHEAYITALKDAFVKQLTVLKDREEQILAELERVNSINHILLDGLCPPIDPQDADPWPEEFEDMQFVLRDGAGSRRLVRVGKDRSIGTLTQLCSILLGLPPSDFAIMYAGKVIDQYRDEHVVCSITSVVTELDADARFSQRERKGGNTFSLRARRHGKTLPEHEEPVVFASDRPPLVSCHGCGELQHGDDAEPCSGRVFGSIQLWNARGVRQRLQT